MASATADLSSSLMVTICSALASSSWARMVSSAPAGFSAAAFLPRGLRGFCARGEAASSSAGISGSGSRGAGSAAGFRGAFLGAALLAAGFAALLAAGLAALLFAALLAAGFAALLMAGLAPLGAEVFFAAVLRGAVFFAGAFSGLVLGSASGSQSSASHILVGGTTIATLKGSPCAFKGSAPGPLPLRPPGRGRRR